MWVLYRLLTLLAGLPWLLYLRSRHGGCLGHRLGLLPVRADRPVWVQAVSVGEVRLALALASLLEGRGLPLLLTATTAAGLALAAKGGREPSAFPADVPWAARRALRRVRPRLLVLVETELWPGLVRAAAREGIPVLVVNGRLSDRSLARTLLFRGVFGRVLANVRVAARSPEHGERFVRLGVPRENVGVAGNMKYDLRPPEGFEAQTAELRRLLPEAGGFLWVAGSVREGEEATVLEAHRLLRQKHPGARLVVAPRHLDRTDRCAGEASSRGMTAARRSDSAAARGGWDVLVLDTLGELWAAYGLGQAAFVGGSLVPLGGQNPLEPAALERPVLFGPSMENFADEAANLLEAGGAVRVESAGALAAELARLLADARARSIMGAAGRAVVAAHRGAADRVALAVVTLAGGATPTA